MSYLLTSLIVTSLIVDYQAKRQAALDRAEQLKKERKAKQSGEILHVLNLLFKCYMLSIIDLP